MYGWIGTILRVNLTNRTVKKEPLDPALAKQYIGARGLGTKIMYDEVDPRVGEEKRRREQRPRVPLPFPLYQALIRPQLVNVFLPCSR